MKLLLILITCFVLVGLAPLLTRLLRSRTGLVLALHPIISFFILLNYAFHPDTPMSVWIHYNPDTWLRLSFWLDTKSLSLSLITCGVSTVVLMDMFPGCNNLDEIQSKTRQVFFLMGAMFGLFLFDHVAFLFVFWTILNWMIFLMLRRTGPVQFSGFSINRYLFFGISSLFTLIGLFIPCLVSGIPEPSQWDNNLLVIVEDVYAGIAFFFIFTGISIMYHLFHVRFFRSQPTMNQAPARDNILFSMFGYSALYLLSRVFPII